MMIDERVERVESGEWRERERERKREREKEREKERELGER